MSVSPVQDPPLVRAVTVVRGVLDRVVNAEASFLTPREKASVLAEVALAEAQLASVRSKVLAVGADVAELHATRDVAAWVAHETRQDVRSVRRDARLAYGVEFTHPATGRALAAGRVGVEQARVIVTGLDKLPAEVDTETVDRAEAYLIEQAQHFAPEQLRVLARRVLDVVAPEIAEQALARQLADEERDAYAKAKVTTRSNGDGTTLFRVTVPDLVASRFQRILDAYASPRRHAADGSIDLEDYEDHAGGAPLSERRGSYPHRLGQALCQWLESVDPTKLPDQGGDATVVMVTLSIEQLQAELATATLADPAIPGATDALSAGEARRLACNAGIIPAVLGSDSQVLDLGRTARFHNAAQRKALRLRHRHCQADGCTIPAVWCEAHHDNPWHQGGRTDLASTSLLCSWHHHRAHDPGIETKRLTNGDWRFRPRH